MNPIFCMMCDSDRIMTGVHIQKKVSYLSQIPAKSPLHEKQWLKILKMHRPNQFQY